MTRYAIYPILHSPDLRPKYDGKFSDAHFLSAMTKMREPQEVQTEVAKYVLGKVSDISGVGKMQDRFNNYWDLLWYAHFKGDQKLYRRIISEFTKSIYFTENERRNQFCRYFEQLLTYPISSYIANKQFSYLKKLVVPLTNGLTSCDFSHSLIQENQQLNQIINILYRLDAILDNIPSLLKNSNEAQFILKDAIYSKDRMSRASIKHLLESENEHLIGWGKYSQARKYLEARKFVEAAERFSQAEMHFETNKSKNLALIGLARSIYWATYHNKISRNEALERLLILNVKITKKSLKSDVQEYIEKIKQEMQK